MSLVHEVFHAVIQKYREAHPSSARRFVQAVRAELAAEAKQSILDFLEVFPPPAVYRSQRGEGDVTAALHFDRIVEDAAGSGMYASDPTDNTELEINEELLLLWITNQNPAYEPVKVVISDEELPRQRYRAFVSTARTFFEHEPAFGPRGETLVDLLLLPGRLHPTSIFGQLEMIGRTWGEALGLTDLPFWRQLSWAQDLRVEEGKWFAPKGGPGPGTPLLESMTFGPRKDDEPARFSPDLGWMPNVVLLAKSVYVWLDQLSKKYQRHIHRLDQVPDEELDLLRARHITGLWLIGLFERSPASRRVKQMRGDHDALASAYSLRAYNIAEELGGVAAYENLKGRAWQRGVRLAADMVPNHVGIDGDWVMQHPEWFLQSPHPPFPNYRFGGPDLSDDQRVGVFLEEGYWNKTDAAVVFRRHDNPDARRAVIETILHVARMFPIIRFDAAMTLAKRHIQRLWYPLPGQAGAIPSRADHAMTQEEFDRAIPIEFWREVVDTIQERAPDTLLLAEAFWMMEGYFVRTLGMHRVYNSAFMNMLKREENEKYRLTIKNVLDFDAEILKRFVNFMNNPDEETAIAQFGADDKYFGVCVLMCTMPGLPMFGHGQIEGLQEKYGMEYRRARYDEGPKPWLIERHEREIFPLLEKRWLFSGVENFALYDFVTDSGAIDEDVYAYSNRVGPERALVIYNNKFKSTRGTILRSTHRGTLGHELALDEDQGFWVILRDVPHGLDYIRPTRDILEGGMTWELHAFKYHVLTGFRPVMATIERPYDRLAAELGGRGVPDMEKAVRELYLRPIHAPLREACSKGHLAYLRSQLSAANDVAPRAELEERLMHVADGLDWMLCRRTDRDVAVDRAEPLRAAGDRFALLHALVRTLAAATPPEEDPELLRDTEPDVTVAAMAAADAGLATPDEKAEAKDAPEAIDADEKEEKDGKEKDEKNALGVDLDLLLSWLQVETVIDLLALAEPAVEEARSKPRVPTADELLMPILGPDGKTTNGAASSSAPPPPPGSVPAAPSSKRLLPDPSAPKVIAAGSSPSSPAIATSAPSSKRVVAAPASSSTLLGASPATSVTSVTLATAPSWSQREAILAEWDLATPLVDAFLTASAPDEARRRVALVLLGATLPSGPLKAALRLALGSRRGQTFMNVHESGGTIWLNKERLEELARFLAEREAILGERPLDAWLSDAQEIADMAAREGYKAERIAANLGALPKTDAPIRR